MMLAFVWSLLATAGYSVTALSSPDYASTSGVVLVYVILVAAPVLFRALLSDGDRKR